MCSKATVVNGYSHCCHGHISPAINCRALAYYNYLPRCVVHSYACVLDVYTERHYRCSYAFASCCICNRLWYAPPTLVGAFAAAWRRANVSPLLFTWYCKDWFVWSRTSPSSSACSQIARWCLWCIIWSRLVSWSFVLVIKVDTTHAMYVSRLLAMYAIPLHEPTCHCNLDACTYVCLLHLFSAAGLSTTSHKNSQPSYVHGHFATAVLLCSACISSKECLSPVAVLSLWQKHTLWQLGVNPSMRSRYIIDRHWCVMFKHLAWSLVKLHAASHAMNIEPKCNVKDQGQDML